MNKAKDSFQAAILKDPQSDLAAYARQYQNMVEERIFLERPFRFAIGIIGQNDTNLLSRWTDYPSQPWTGDKEEANALNTSFRINYMPMMKGPWLFSAQYALSSGLHDRYTHSYDSLANSINLTPGYNFGRCSINLVTGYNHTLLRAPSYKRYQGWGSWTLPWVEYTPGFRATLGILSGRMLQII